MAIPTIRLEFDPTTFDLMYEKTGEGPVEMRVDLDEMTRIVPERINELLCGTPARWLWWASVSEQLQQRLRALKNSRDSRLSEVSISLRDAWNEATQGKRTESALLERAKSDETYCRYIAEIEQMEFFTQLTLRIKEGLMTMNANLASLSANLRTSGEAYISEAPVIRTDKFTGAPTPGVQSKKPIVPSHATQEGPPQTSAQGPRRVFRKPPSNPQQPQ